MQKISKPCTLGIGITYFGKTDICKTHICKKRIYAKDFLASRKFLCSKSVRIYANAVKKIKEKRFAKRNFSREFDSEPF